MVTSPGPPPQGDRQPSTIMAAILDAVAEPSPSEEAGASRTFQARAMAEADIPRQVDSLLPITTPRLWIAIVGMVVLLAAGVIYAAGTPRVSGVTAEGRVVAGSGVAMIDSPTEMSLTDVAVDAGTQVLQGDILATGTDIAGAPVSIRAPGDGLVWQVLASPGQAVVIGEPLVTLLPSGSSDNVLVAIEEGESGGVIAGQKAIITGTGIDSQGTVAEVPTAPLAGKRATELTAFPLDPQAAYVLVSVTSSAPLPSGAAVQVELVESESTLLGDLLSF